MTSPITTGCIDVYCHKTMAVLPEGFADDLARVVQPGHRDALAEIITTATLLDDRGLTSFLRLFAERVRSSDRLITREELRALLQRAAAGA